MRINPTDAAALRAVVRKDLGAISRLEQHLTTLSEGKLTREKLDSLGFALHNIYNALENSFSQLSLTFENHIKDQVRWPREMLAKMFLEVPPLRPAILPAGVKPLLSDLLGFRHLFRHGYELPLDEAKTIALSKRWQSEGSEGKTALQTFADNLAEIASAS